MDFGDPDAAFAKADPVVRETYTSQPVSAVPLPVPSTMFGAITRTVFPGPHRIDHMRWQQTVVASNKATYGFYRGPWAAESLVREALVDRIARELGLDPVDVRRRNLLRLDEQPRKMATGATLDGATTLESLQRAVELAGADEFRAGGDRQLPG